MKKFTYDEIIADAEAQFEKLSSGANAVVIPPDITAQARKISGKKTRLKSLRAQADAVEAEIDSLQKEIGSYLVEHPSGFFLKSAERPEGSGIQRNADFSEVGGTPELPTGEEAQKINRWIRTAAAKRRYKNTKNQRDALLESS